MRTLILCLCLVLAAPAFAEETTLFRGVGPSSGRIAVAVQTDKAEYAIGEKMGIRVAANADGYVLLYYVDSRGQASVITPSPWSPYHRVTAGQWLYVAEADGSLLEQTGPAGRESLQAIVTREPLDLAALRPLLAEGGGGMWTIPQPDRFVQAVVDIIKTRMRAAASNPPAAPTAQQAPPPPPNHPWANPNGSQGPSPFAAPAAAGTCMAWPPCPTR